MNKTLQSAIKKTTRFNATYYTGYLTQVEMLELIKAGARLEYNKERNCIAIKRIEEQKKKGITYSRWYSFRVPKELGEKIEGWK